MILKRLVFLSAVFFCSLIVSTAIASNTLYDDKTISSKDGRTHINDNNVIDLKKHKDDFCPNLDENIQRPQKGANEFSLMIDSLSKDTPNYSEAFFYAKDAAKENFCNAFGYLGTFYMQGLGIKKDLNEAYNAFIKGYKCNDLQSIYGLSKIYKLGYIDSKGQGGLNKELFYLQIASDKNYVPAQYDLAVILLNQDPESSYGIKLLKAAANGRYAPAISLYYKKYATTKDPNLR